MPADLVRPSLSMQKWLSDYEVSGLTSFSDDFDNDGLVNAVEFVLGSSPAEATNNVMRLSKGAGGMSLLHPHNTQSLNDVGYRYEWSSDLINFQKSGESSNGLTVSLVPFRNVPTEGMTSVSVESEGDAESLFFRMIVEPKE